MTKKTVPFNIGEEMVDVPELCWASLEDVVLPLMEASRLRLPDGVTPALPWWTTRGNDVRIIAEAVRRTRPDLTLEVIRERLNLTQSMALTENLLELLKVSGFTMPGEAEAAGPSTETSVDSSPTS